MKKDTHIALLAILLIAFVPALISCSSAEEMGPDDDSQELPIGFYLDGLTRAVDLSTIYDNFCVRSVKETSDGTKSLVIPNYFVKYIGTKWIYEGLTTPGGSTQFLKYWDLSANSYTFAAVAPSSSAGTTYSIDDDGNVKITLANLSTDWMIARTIRKGVNAPVGLLDYDDIEEDIQEIMASPNKSSEVFPRPNAPHSDVPLNFHRILAKVVIKAYAEEETELTPLEVGFNNIGIVPAIYNMSSDEWTTTSSDYQQIYNQNTLITDEQNSRETAQQLTELYVIPQQTTSVQIKVKPDNDDDRVSTFNLLDLWESNNIYTYYLKFESGDTGQVILFDFTVEPWSKGGEAEDVQTNW